MAQLPLTPKSKPNSDGQAHAIEVPGKYPEGSVPGLFLQVTPSSKIWRLKFRLHGKEGLYTIGRFPDISHTRACELAQAARTSVAEGVAPLKAKKARIEAEQAKEGWTFKKVCDLWLISKGDLAKKTLLNYRSTLDLHVLPALGVLPVSSIEYSHIRKVLTVLAPHPAAAAHALVTMRAVLEYGVELELIKDNVAANRGRGLIMRRKTVHHAAIDRPEGLKEYLRRLNDIAPPNSPVTWSLWLLALLPVRPSELANMRWEDVDMQAAEWRYKVPKTGRQHIVPLAPQVLAQLALIRERSAQVAIAAVPMPFGGVAPVMPPTGWVFASTKKVGRPISPTTMLLGIRALGYEKGELTSHGFRSTFRSLAHEELGVEAIVLELCLGHRMPGPLSDTYARAHLLPQRREAMVEWANYVEGLWFEAVNGCTREEAASALTPKGLTKQ